MGGKISLHLSKSRKEELVVRRSETKGERQDKTCSEEKTARWRKNGFIETLDDQERSWANRRPVHHMNERRIRPGWGGSMA